MLAGYWEIALIGDISWSEATRKAMAASGASGTPPTSAGWVAAAMMRMISSPPKISLIGPVSEEYRWVRSTFLRYRVSWSVSFLVWCSSSP